MEWAIKDGDKVSAEPNEKAQCPICNQELISKCGSIKIWHWSHKSNKDCDDWYEPETQWHRDWKNEFPKEQQEVIIGNHRADIYEPNQMRVIELQNSSIPSDDIKERENFYENMIWLLNGEKFTKGLSLRKKNSQGLNNSDYSNGKLFNRFNKEIYTFRWKNPPKSWWFANKEIYIDLNNYEKEIEERGNLYVNGSPYLKYLLQFKNKIFLIKKIYHDIPCGGWGELIDKEEFIKKFT